MSAEVDSGKNFRSAYYGSLGFREEEKVINQLDALLKEEPIDILKLQDFCLKHSLPLFYRSLVWKLLSKYEPVHKDKETYEFIISQRREEFHDLKSALRVIESSQTICHISLKTSSPNHSLKAEDIVTMYCIQHNILNIIRYSDRVDLCAMAQPFLEWYKDEMDVYYVFSGFASLWSSIFHLENMIKEFYHFLYNLDPLVYHHLESLQAFSSIPFNRWYGSCFASDLPLAELEILWDRVIAGSWVVVIFVSLSIVLYYKRQLLMTSNYKNVSKLLEQLPEKDSSLIVQQGLEMWIDNGSHKHFSSHKKSK